MFFLPPAVIGGTGFEAACEKLASEAAIRVVFEDRPVSRDDSRQLDVLKRLSGAGTNPYHSVLGLTHAEPAASLDVMPRILTDVDGQVCGVSSLRLQLGFSALQVYLASELRDSCRRRLVEEHELEHVAVWRNHLRVAARMLETLLRRKLGETAYFRTPAEADETLRRQADQLIAPLLKNLKDGIVADQQQIDSAASYQYLEGRLRACP
ncbi:hypothetical protein [Dechloromonas denitrificans]|uniref:hypothetical protein n=1 Tax=Dechloromonas denitrificans TaxID=281362 RepID=UPI001CF97E4E|nr:hypothetical protein [Dechloromonas denitrificans]UCV09827.1 hypothetical protein KI615_10070 [Dechloromonas denitrificans]